jgi:hypothetical protein
VGFSPVERCTAHGETAWIPLEQIRNIRLEPLTSIGAGTTSPARGRGKNNTATAAK